MLQTTLHIVLLSPTLFQILVHLLLAKRALRRRVLDQLPHPARSGARKNGSASHPLLSLSEKLENLLLL